MRQRIAVYIMAILAVFGVSAGVFMAPAQAANSMGRISVAPAQVIHEGRGKLTVPVQASSMGRISVAPAMVAASYPTYGTYGYCQNGASWLARVGVYWQVNGFVVRPYQVWFDQAKAPIYKMEVWYYWGNTLKASHAFAQTGQRSQVHNWGGLPWGSRNSSTKVKFRLTAANGAQCVGIVGAAA
jgi:hypothetical protein